MYSTSRTELQYQEGFLTPGGGHFFQQLLHRFIRARATATVLGVHPGQTASPFFFTFHILTDASAALNLIWTDKVAVIVISIDGGVSVVTVLLCFTAFDGFALTDESRRHCKCHSSVGWAVRQGGSLEKWKYQVTCLLSIDGEMWEQVTQMYFLKKLWYILLLVFLCDVLIQNPLSRIKKVLSLITSCNMCSLKPVDSPVKRDTVWQKRHWGAVVGSRRCTEQF